MEDFGAFVRRDGTQLLRVAFLLTGDAHLAEDLVQTVLARVALRWSRVSAMESPAAYARTAIVNTSRSWRLRRWHGERATASPPEVRAPDDVARYDAYHEVVTALRRLPRRQREVIVLRYYEDLSESEIASVLGCSAGSVKTHAARGLAALRDMYDEEGRSHAR